MKKLIEVRAFNAKGLPVYQSTFEVEDTKDIMEQVHKRIWKCVSDRRHPLRDEKNIFDILGIKKLEMRFV